MLLSPRWHNLRMDITDLPDDAQRPKPPKKTALEKLREDVLRPLAPFRQIQEVQDWANKYSTENQSRELYERLKPERQHRELLGLTIIPKHVQEMLNETATAFTAQRLLERYLPKIPLILNDDAILRSAAELNSVAGAAKAYEKYLAPLTAQQELLQSLQRQAFGGISAKDLVQQFEYASPAFGAMATAKNSLDKLWGSFKGIDFGDYESDDAVTKDAEVAAESIARAASVEPTFKDAVDQIIEAIQAQKNPTVQLLLFLFFRKVLDWMIAGAIGTVMGIYVPPMLVESPQAASKAFKAAAREVVGVPELLVEYRYVSAKVLIVRQNPRGLSPEVGRLKFGNAVKIVKKDKDFTLVIWTETNSGATIQGWVFSRYLGKFN